MGTFVTIYYYNTQPENVFSEAIGFACPRNRAQPLQGRMCPRITRRTLRSEALAVWRRPQWREGRAVLEDQPEWSCACPRGPEQRRRQLGVWCCDELHSPRLRQAEQAWSAWQRRTGHCRLREVELLLGLHSWAIYGTGQLVPPLPFKEERRRFGALRGAGVPLLRSAGGPAEAWRSVDSAG